MYFAIGVSVPSLHRESKAVCVHTYTTNAVTAEVEKTIRFYQ